MRAEDLTTPFYSQWNQATVQIKRDVVHYQSNKCNNLPPRTKRKWHTVPIFVFGTRKQIKKNWTYLHISSARYHIRFWMQELPLRSAHGRTHFALLCVSHKILDLCLALYDKLDAKQRHKQAFKPIRSRNNLFSYLYLNKHQSSQKQTKSTTSNAV